MYPSSAAGHRANVYIVGGRKFNHTEGKWSYLKGAFRYNARLRRWWRLPDVHGPTADSCMIFHDDTLYLIGGAKDLSGTYSDTVELITYGLQAATVTIPPNLPFGVAAASAIPVTDCITFGSRHWMTNRWKK